jgi:hypothetical protein
MQMGKVQIEDFLERVRDQRKAHLNPKSIEVYFYNPLDCRGTPSSFVFVVLISKGKSKGIYCAGSKYNPCDGIDPAGKGYQSFSLNEGLTQACNRVWREFRGMPSTYGRGYTPKTKKPHARLLKLMQRYDAMGAFPPFSLRRSQMLKGIAEEAERDSVKA